MTTDRSGHNRALTRAEQDFLKQLRFRQQHTDGAFIFSLPRGRWGLIVRTMMNTHEVHSKFTKNPGTLAALKSAGLITIDPIQKLPKPFGPGGAGHRIAITDIGRDAIG